MTSLGLICIQIFLLTIVGIHVVAGSSRVKCYKDKSLGSRYPSNVYYCDDPDKPECCEEKNQFTCCENRNKKNWREQLQLWGALGLVVVLIAVVVICWRKDTYLCEGETLKERCSNCCRRRCKRSQKEDGAIKIRISRKYRKAPDSPHPDSTITRENTSVATHGIDPEFTSQDLHATEEVDSGRGSVASSSPVHLHRRNDFLPSSHSNSADLGDVMNLSTYPGGPECSTSRQRKGDPDQIFRESFVMMATSHEGGEENYQSKRRKKKKKKQSTDEQEEEKIEYESKRSKRKKRKGKKTKETAEDEDIL